MLILNYQELVSIDFETLVEVGGFVHTIRDHGGLIFIDLRSENSLLQCVINPQTSPTLFTRAEKLKPEFVLKVSGILKQRTPETVNPEIETGKFELEISDFELIAKAQTPPFEIHNSEGGVTSEDIRLKYRYLDFRREKLKKMMWLRHKFILATRNWFDKQGFIEVQTPILANSSPEGARDYLVPSRLHPGKFFALPQAPQQFKQLLMVGGFNKYFQIAPCFRDEDPRADRAIGDFYQIDLEMAFARQEDIFNLFEKFAHEVLSNPEFSSKRIPDKTFQRITYLEAMDSYGSDKPDLRYDLKWTNVKEVFKDSGFEVFSKLCDQKDSRISALHLPGQIKNFSRSDLDKIQELGKSFGLPGIAYIQYLPEEDKSPIFKFLKDGKQQEIKKFFKAKTGDLILFLANEDKKVVYKAQNQIRTHIALKLGLIDDSILKFVWVYDFPFFEKDEKTGKLNFCHNPFGVWKAEPGKTILETLNSAISSGTCEQLIAKQYDITCNGLEISSGGERNNDPEAILKAFSVAGYSTETVKQQFGHMLSAYRYGAPYHAGFAPGVDRILMILTGEENIREVIPFPKNGSGQDPLTGAPGSVTAAQLKELNIKTLY